MLRTELFVAEGDSFRGLAGSDGARVNSDLCITFIFRIITEQSTGGCFRALDRSAAQYYIGVPKRSRF